MSASMGDQFQEINLFYPHLLCKPDHICCIMYILPHRDKVDFRSDSAGDSVGNALP